MHITLQGYLIAYSLIFPFIFKVWTFIWLEEAEFFLFQGKYTHPTSQSGKHRQLRLFSSNKLPKKTSQANSFSPWTHQQKKNTKNIQLQVILVNTFGFTYFNIWIFNTFSFTMCTSAFLKWQSFSSHGKALKKFCTTCCRLVSFLLHTPHILEMIW